MIRGQKFRAVANRTPGYVTPGRINLAVERLCTSSVCGKIHLNYTLGGVKKRRSRNRFSRNTTGHVPNSYSVHFRCSWTIRLPLDLFKEAQHIMELWEESKIVFQGKILKVRVGSVVLDDNTKAYREVVEHPGGACVLPYTGEGFVFVRQFRIALGQDVLEAPAGKLELGETPEGCARKELREETGFQGESLISLGTVFPSVGFSSEIIHLYLATGLTDIGKDPEPDERIETVFLALDDVRKKINGPFFQDAKTNIVVYRAIQYLDTHAFSLHE